MSRERDVSYCTAGVIDYCYHFFLCWMEFVAVCFLRGFARVRNAGGALHPGARSHFKGSEV